MAAPKTTNQPNMVPVSSRPTSSTTAFQQAGVYANETAYDPTAIESFEFKIGRAHL